MDSALTTRVVDAFSQIESPRLKNLLGRLVSDMHRFLRENQVTRDELDAALDFMNKVGRATNDSHNEAILLGDVLGVTTLVCENDGGGEEEALLGPFWRMHSPRTPNGGSIVRSPTPGSPLKVEAQFLDTRAQPMADVEVDVWQASPVGLYENQDDEQVDMNLRGKFHTDREGRIAFATVVPAGYPVPVHGPVGSLLKIMHRHPFRPAHLHFLAIKAGYRTLISQIFVPGDEFLDSDVVFGARDSLIGEFSIEDDGQLLRRTFTMREGVSTLPNPPIK